MKSSIQFKVAAFLTLFLIHELLRGLDANEHEEVAMQAKDAAHTCIPPINHEALSRSDARWKSSTAGVCGDMLSRDGVAFLKVIVADAHIA